MPIRRRPLPIGVVFLALAVTLACGPTPPPAPAPPPAPVAPANPLQGAWSQTATDPGDGSPVIDPSQPGLYIFVEGYYSAVYTIGTEPRVLAEVAFQPTPEEMVAQHESIIVNAGTYEISGSTVTFRPIIAKSPGFVGGQSTSGFQINGDTLTLTAQTIVAADGKTSPPNAGGSSTWRRVE